jgi:phage tail tape-measure protein
MTMNDIIPLPPVVYSLEDAVNSGGDDDLKKVVAAGSVLLQKFKKPENPLSTEEITHIADSGVSAVKVAYKVGTGELDPTDAVNDIIDREAAILGTVVQTTCEKVGEKAGAVVGRVIGTLFGPVGAVAGAAIGAKIGRFAGQAVGKYIIPGIKKAANFCKSVVRKGWAGVKAVGRAIVKGAKEVGRAIASIFGF